jgi:hypothetical protein
VVQGAPNRSAKGWRRFSKLGSFGQSFQRAGVKNPELAVSIAAYKKQYSITQSC